MVKNILGLSFMYHDSAASLLMDGEVVAAAAEERFSRVKHSLDFPEKAIEACLAIGGIAAQDLDAIVFYEKPLLKFERIITMNARTFPRGFRLFLESIPLWLKYKLFIPDIIRSNTGYKGEIFFADHHYAHAASAFFASGFDRAAILTMDGVGEWATMTKGTGQGNRITLASEGRYPHSLGLLYSTVTAFLGFRVNSGEGKVMGLAPYGEPTFYDQLVKDVIDIRQDGSFRLDLRYFRFFRDTVMYSPLFEKAFGPPRTPEGDISRRDRDLAASLQKVTEEIMLKCAGFLFRETSEKNLCIAGGVGLNGVANGRVLEELDYEDIFIQPASGDDGGAIGAALYYYHHILAGPRKWKMTNAFLGPSFTSDEIRNFLVLRNIPFRQEENRKELSSIIAEYISQGKIVGWMQGKMEYGPRALGNRSILANPTLTEMKDTLNKRVKNRESFRPFAPAVLRESAGEFFESDFESPYMLLVSRVKESRKELLSAVTHVDGTARVQTVTREQNPMFYDLIEQFGKITGTPVLLNTSFNVRGEPIVCDFGDALECFLNTDMDVLVMEDLYVLKTELLDSGKQ